MKVWVTERCETQHPFKDIAQRGVPGGPATLDPLAGVPKAERRVGGCGNGLASQQFTGEDPKRMQATICGAVAGSCGKGRVDHPDVSRGRKPDPFRGDRRSEPTEPFEDLNEDAAYFLWGRRQPLAASPGCPHEEGAACTINGSPGMGKIPGWDESPLLHG